MSSPLYSTDPVKISSSYLKCFSFFRCDEYLKKYRKPVCIRVNSFATIDFYLLQRNVVRSSFVFRSVSSYRMEGTLRYTPTLLKWIKINTLTLLNIFTG